jgi:hypothetical protein
MQLIDLIAFISFAKSQHFILYQCVGLNYTTAPSTGAKYQRSSVAGLGSNGAGAKHPQQRCP